MKTSPLGTEQNILQCSASCQISCPSPIDFAPSALLSPEVSISLPWHSCAIFLKSHPWSSHQMLSYFSSTPDPTCSRFPHQWSWCLLRSIPHAYYKITEYEHVSVWVRLCCSCSLAFYLYFVTFYLLVRLFIICSIKHGSLHPCLHLGPPCVCFKHQLWQYLTIMEDLLFHFLRVRLKY